MNDRHPALDALLDGRLTGAQRRAAFAHLDGCESCRVEYERMVLAERALAGGDLDKPTVLEREATLAAVLAETVPPARPRWPVWVGVPAFAAAAALLVVFWPRDAGFVEKGRSGESVASVRAFCVQQGQARQLTAAVPCARGATLVVSARQPRSATLRPTLSLVDAAGKIHNAVQGAAPMPVVNADSEQAIDAFIDVDASVAPGPATLYLIWCAQCDEAATAAVLEGARRGHAHNDTVQSIEVMIVEGTP